MTTEHTTIQLPVLAIELQLGERYAGTVLDADGNVKHHLVLLPNRPDADLTWQAAMDWAASVGGQLPDRQEQALLYANCKPHLKPKWHWSREEHHLNPKLYWSRKEHPKASYAWFCTFTNGSHYGHPKSFEVSAVAVRQFPA